MMILLAALQALRVLTAVRVAVAALGAVCALGMVSTLAAGTQPLLGLPAHFAAGESASLEVIPVTASWTVCNSNT